MTADSWIMNRTARAMGFISGSATLEAPPVHVLYSLNPKKATVGHKNFSFCEQTLHEGLIDASCNWLQSTGKNIGQNNFLRKLRAKNLLIFIAPQHFLIQIFKIVCTSSKFNTFHAKSVSF
jgi:hypothetical protein